MDQRKPQDARNEASTLSQTPQPVHFQGLPSTVVYAVNWWCPIKLYQVSAFGQTNCSLVSAYFWGNAHRDTRRESVTDRDGINCRCEHLHFKHEQSCPAKNCITKCEPPSSFSLQIAFRQRTFFPSFHPSDQSSSSCHIAGNLSALSCKDSSFFLCGCEWAGKVRCGKV